MRGGNFEPQSGALILLSGLPGAGKTTFARALAATLPFDHIESDAIRRALTQTPTYSGPESGRVFARAEALADATLRAGRIALLDATNLATNDRKRFLELAERFHAAVIPVRVVAPDDVIRTRLASPRAGFSQATAAVYEMMKDRARLFTVPTVVVDTRFPLEPSVALVRALALAPTPSA